MKSESISIVVPMYNVRDTIKRAVDSIIAQNDTNIEVILVDDGSTDDTVEVIRPFLETYPYFKLISHNRNKSLHEARRSGVNEATGDYTLFLDSDDELLEGSFDLIRNNFEKDIDVILATLTVTVPKDFPYQVQDFWYTSIFKSQRVLTGADQIESTYYYRDTNWGFTGRVYRTHILKNAWDSLPELYLNGCEDCAEQLAALSFSRAEKIIPQSFYHYHFGDGGYGISKSTPDKVLSLAKSVNDTLNLCIDFFKQHPNKNSELYLLKITQALYHLIAFEIEHRLNDSDKLLCLDELFTIVDDAYLAESILLHILEISWDFHHRDKELANTYMKFAREVMLKSIHTSVVLPGERIALNARKALCKDDVEFISNDTNFHKSFASCTYNGVSHYVVDFKTCINTADLSFTIRVPEKGFLLNGVATLTLQDGSTQVYPLAALYDKYFDSKANAMLVHELKNVFSFNGVDVDALASLDIVFMYLRAQYESDYSDYSLRYLKDALEIATGEVGYFASQHAIEQIKNSQLSQEIERLQKENDLLKEKVQKGLKYRLHDLVGRFKH